MVAVGNILDAGSNLCAATGSFQKMTTLDQRLTRREKIVAALADVVTDHPWRVKEDIDHKKATLDALITEAGLLPVNGKDGH